MMHTVEILNDVKVSYLRSGVYVFSNSDISVYPLAKKLIIVKALSDFERPDVVSFLVAGMFHLYDGNKGSGHNMCYTVCRRVASRNGLNTYHAEISHRVKGYFVHPAWMYAGYACHYSRSIFNYAKKIFNRNLWTDDLHKRITVIDDIVLDRIVLNFSFHLWNTPWYVLPTAAAGLDKFFSFIGESALTSTLSK